jgi:hypothetical protein
MAHRRADNGVPVLVKLDDSHFAKTNINRKLDGDQGIVSLPDKGIHLLGKKCSNRISNSDIFTFLSIENKALGIT